MSATYPILSLDHPGGIVDHLKTLGWLDAAEEVTGLERAGEGNMNLVVRIHTAERSVILKQSRPWVEKYPSIAAPENRLLVEAAFYQAAAASPSVSRMMPGFLTVDRESRCALMVDLGRAQDCTDVYRGSLLDVGPLIDWLSDLHAVTVAPGLVGLFQNQEMRALNHAHIFDLPMSGAHGMNLDEITPGLSAAADRFRSAEGTQTEVSELGALYLADGGYLLHGDFYPGSWLRTESGPMVIDPEFCFLGPAEFDLGVMMAHLLVAGYDVAACGGLLARYRGNAEGALVWKFAGVELMRRLIGVAQLPIRRALQEKEALLDQANTLIRG